MTLDDPLLDDKVCRAVVHAVSHYMDNPDCGLIESVYHVVDAWSDESYNPQAPDPVFTEQIFAAIASALRHAEIGSRQDAAGHILRRVRHSAS